MNRCEWIDPEGNQCECEGTRFSRGLLICDRHFKLLRYDNKYRARHGHEIPDKSCEMKRVVRVGLLKA